MGAAEFRHIRMLLGYHLSKPHEQEPAELTKTRRAFLRASPEWVVTVVLLCVALGLQRSLEPSLHWAFFSPAFHQTMSLGGWYLAIAVFLWLGLRAGLKRASLVGLIRRLSQQAGDAFCFGLVVSLTLTIKLWEPLIRTASYDRAYEAIDRTCFFWMNPLIAWRARELQFSWIDHLYFVLFFGMFLVSFVTHNLRGRAEFRRVLLASLLVQGFGGILYYAAPAVGPFLYHASANDWIGGMQQTLQIVRHYELAGGAQWLKANGGSYLADGLAAMPSLHAAASFVFLYYAWRRVRWLGYVYTPAFVWILFGAMASRWHYGIDLIAGVALAYLCIALSNRWMGAHEAAWQPESPTPAVSKLDERAIAVTR